MTNLNQTDLLVRLQLLGCKYGELANQYANDLKYGKKCSNEHMRNLMLLNSYIELLQCYKPLNLTSSLATGYFQLNFIDNPTLVTVQLYIDSTAIMNSYTLTSTNTTTEMVAIGNLINAYQSTYIASVGTYEGNPAILITGDCNNPTLTAVVNKPFGNKTSYAYTGLTGGSCLVTEEDNCLTEEQLQSMLNVASKLTDICFQSAGFNYAEADSKSIPTCTKYRVTSNEPGNVEYVNCNGSNMILVKSGAGSVEVCSRTEPVLFKATIEIIGEC